MRYRVSALVSGIAAVVILGGLGGCGGGGAYTLPDPWALTEVATGAPQYVATTGFVSIQDSGAITVYDPTGSPVTYPVAGDYVLANNGGVISQTSDGFDYYAPGATTPDHVVFPNAKYCAPFGVDSQGRVYGISKTSGGTPVTLWLYENSVFTALPGPASGSVSNEFIDASDKVIIELAAVAGSHYLRYTDGAGWTDFETVTSTGNTVDDNGFICGTEYTIGGLATPASVYNGHALALYDVPHNYNRGTVLGVDGTRVFGNSYLGSSVLPVVWEGNGVTSLSGRVVLGTSHFDRVVAVTSKGVVFVYTTDQGDTKTGLFKPN